MDFLGFCLDFVGFEHARVLVHGVDRTQHAVQLVVLRRTTKLLLDDRILQRSRLPHRYATGACCHVSSA